VVLVVLFGSKARGEADEESDPDVLVVVKNAEQFTLNELAKAQRFVARVEEHLSKRDLYAEQGV
jgi:predicted nucleotidyltransferase